MPPTGLIWVRRAKLRRRPWRSCSQTKQPEHEMTPINKSELWKKRLGDWVLNDYVGCEHGCLHCYCPAMPGVKFFNHGHSQREWGTYLYPKDGIVEALPDQLRNFTPDKAKRTEWGDGWVLMSFLTDCY